MNDFTADFTSVLGHENVKRHLMTALADGLVSHAYIIEGARGVGKKTLARAFVRALLCQDPVRSSARHLSDASAFELDPSEEDHALPDSCGHCDSCRKIDSGTHPDVHFIRPLEEGKGINVKQIRDDLVSDMQVRPYLDSFKVYIVEQADTMNAQAQNALLKTIEEPPAYGVILLLAEKPSAFLPTILSRCVRISLSPLPDSLVRDALLSRGIDQEKIPSYASFAQGSIGQAIALSEDEGFASMRKELAEFLSRIPSLPMKDVLQGTKLLEEYKASLDSLFSLMTLWYRDVGVYKETSDSSRLYFKDYAQSVAGCANYYNFEKITSIAEVILDTQRRLSSNVNFQLSADCLMIALK